MTRLIDRRRRLVLETSLLIGKRPLVVLVEPWWFSWSPGDWPYVRRGVIKIFRSRGLRFGNRAAVIAAERNRAKKRSSSREEVSEKGEKNS